MAVGFGTFQMVSFGSATPHSAGWNFHRPALQVETLPTQCPFCLPFKSVLSASCRGSLSLATSVPSSLFFTHNLPNQSLACLITLWCLLLRGSQLAQLPLSIKEYKMVYTSTSNIMRDFKQAWKVKKWENKVERTEWSLKGVNPQN